MWQSLLVYNACPQPQTEATVLVSPSLLQIDTFGKWCRCLHNVCYVKLKKRRYLDKCRLSAPAGISGLRFPSLDTCTVNEEGKQLLLKLSKHSGVQKV